MRTHKRVLRPGFLTNEMGLNCELKHGNLDFGNRPAGAYDFGTAAQRNELAAHSFGDVVAAHACQRKELDSVQVVQHL